MKMLPFALLLALPVFGEIEITKRDCNVLSVNTMTITKAVCVDVDLKDETADHLSITMAYLSDGRLELKTKLVPRRQVYASGALFEIDASFQGVQAITVVCVTLEGKSATKTYR